MGSPGERRPKKGPASPWVAQLPQHQHLPRMPDRHLPALAAVRRRTATALDVLLFTLLFTFPAAAVAEPISDPSVSFAKTIQPILAQKCARCHGPDVQKAQLALHTPQALRAGSESGPVISAEKPAESRLLEVVEAGEMPPDGKDPLTEDEIELLRRWITQGADLGEDENAGGGAVTQHQVIPLLLLRCAVCHGGRRQEAQLDVRSRASLLRGGSSGPAIVPGKPEESLLV
ncbi:MAG: hypothetical protein EHM42_06865, partial [Planctomycetaceae bacterium]